MGNRVEKNEVVRTPLPLTNRERAEGEEGRRVDRPRRPGPPRRRPLPPRPYPPPPVVAPPPNQNNQVLQQILPLILTMVMSMFQMMAGLFSQQQQQQPPVNYAAQAVPNINPALASNPLGLSQPQLPLQLGQSIGLPQAGGIPGDLSQFGGLMQSQLGALQSLPNLTQSITGGGLSQNIGGLGGIPGLGGGLEQSIGGLGAGLGVPTIPGVGGGLGPTSMNPLAVPIGPPGLESLTMTPDGITSFLQTDQLQQSGSQIFPNGQQSFFLSNPFEVRSFGRTPWGAQTGFINNIYGSAAFVNDGMGSFSHVISGPSGMVNTDISPLGGISLNRIG